MLLYAVHTTRRAQAGRGRALHRVRGALLEAGGHYLPVTPGAPDAEWRSARATSHTPTTTNGMLSS